MKRSVSMETLKLVLLLAYFPLLTIERIVSLCIMFSSDTVTLTSLDYYMAGLVILSIAAAYAFLAVEFRKTLLNLFNRRKWSTLPRTLTSRHGLRMLTAAAGILLAGGMVHTHGTFAPVQFAAYACILAAMAVHTVQNVKAEAWVDRKWLSFAYVAAYSMAIPVVYHTQIEYARLFIPIEIVVSLGMVILFTLMLMEFFTGNGENRFSLLPFLVAVFGDCLIISMRWNEEVNVFVLIAICIATVLWFSGSILGDKPTKGK